MVWRAVPWRRRIGLAVELLAFLVLSCSQESEFRPPAKFRGAPRQDGAREGERSLAHHRRSRGLPPQQLRPPEDERRMKMLHIAQTNACIFAPVFLAALKELGELDIVENGKAIPDHDRAEKIRQYPVLLTGWNSAPVPRDLAANPGRLRYICNVTGEMRGWIPLEIIDSGIPVTNWGDALANCIAEGAAALLLATLKDLHLQIQTIRRGGAMVDPAITGGTIEELDLGLYGCGAIGRRFIELIRPFGPVIRVFDPYMGEPPTGCAAVASLDELFSRSQAIVILAGLTDETRKSVTAGLLAKLPRHGVVINVARGGIVDQEALFAELKSGRLRAGLDVLEPDILPAEHEARLWENCILTAHGIHRAWPSDGDPTAEPSPMYKAMYQVCLDNLKRFQAGQTLRFVMDRVRYLRST